MAILADAIEDLIAANRILAAQRVVDSFGHVSVRHPAAKDRFFLSRSRAPERVEAADIMEFTLDGECIDTCGRTPYLERFIHAAAYQVRPDVNAVVHSHSPAVIPFGVTSNRLRPIMHMCAGIGADIPVWDQRHRHGDTDLLVRDVATGRDLIGSMNGNRTALMRGHGCVVVGQELRETVYTAIYLELNARIQIQAEQMGQVTFLSNGEIERVCTASSNIGIERAWENWCLQAERPYRARTHVG